MDEAEFDKFADEYRLHHAANIRASGEAPEFFARYKVVDAAALTVAQRLDHAIDILDFGAGVGSSVPHFLELFPASRLTCVDVSRRSLEIGSAKFGAVARFLHFDGSTVPLQTGSFDLVFVACVLHHIPHHEHPHLLGELQRLLRPGGSLVAFEHNPYNPLTVRAVNNCEFDGNAELVHPRALQAACLAAGYCSARVRYRIFFPHALRTLRGVEPWLTWLPLGAQYSVHAIKR